MHLAQVDQAALLATTRFGGNDKNHTPMPTFSADGSLLAVWDWIHSPLRLWQTVTRQPLPTLDTSCQHFPAFSPGNDRMAVAGYKEITVWEIATGRRVARFPWYDADAEYKELHFDRSGQALTLLTARELASLSLADATTRIVHGFEPPDDGVAFANPTPGPIVFTHYEPDRSDVPDARCFEPCRVSKLDLRTGQRLFTTDEIWTWQCTPDRRWGLLCSDPYDGCYEVWDLDVGRRCGGLTVGPDSFERPPKLSPDGRYVVWADGEGTSLRVWDVRRQAVVQEIERRDWCFEGLSPTHRLLVLVRNRRSEGIDRTVFLDPLTGAALGRAEKHPISDVSHAFSPCGSRYASAVDAASYGVTCHPDPIGTVYLTDLTLILPLAQKWESAGAA